MALIIVADDLTGACDAGTLFAGKAPVPVTVWPDPPVAAEVAVVDTESRRLDRAAATDRVSDAAEIGRASCRERGESGGGQRYVKEKRSRRIHAHRQTNSART